MKAEIMRMDHVFMGQDKENMLSDFHLSVYSGELINLIGLTGSGKNAFWEYFSGNLDLKKGSVSVGNKAFNHGKMKLAGRDVVCLGHEITLIERLTIAENLFVISDVRMRQFFIRSKRIEIRTKIILNDFAPFLKEDMPVALLTYAQRRMVELIKAYVVEAKLIIIDDTFMSFGKSDIENLILILNKLKEKGIAILYISHCQDFLTPFADRTIVLRNGHHIRTFYPQDFHKDLCDQLLRGGMKLSYDKRSEKAFASKHVFFQLEQVNAANVLHDISLEFRKGEIIGFCDAENRCNRYLLDMIVGEEKLTSGQMMLNGRKYKPKRLDDAIKHNIGYISRDLKKISLVEQMSFADNLFLPVMKKTSVLNSFMDFSVVNFLSREYCDTLGIEEKYKDYKVAQFDEYIRMSILVHRWFLFKPDMMVCVEPCSRADMIMREIIYDILKKMAANGCCVLISSPDIEEMAPICDKIHYLKNGYLEGMLEY